MKNKTFAIIFTLFAALAAAYLYANKTNAGGIFRIPTPTPTAMVC